MSEFKATLKWKRNTDDFSVKTYDRTHEVEFGGGSSLKLSAAPDYMGKAEFVNPEELFVSSLSSCHMLTFLYLAAMKGLTIDSYTDEAIGVLGKNAEGKMSVTKVTLRPQIIFSGNQPDAALLHDLHEKAHANCFIGNSVTTEVTVAQ